MAPDRERLQDLLQMECLQWCQYMNHGPHWITSDLCRRTLCTGWSMTYLSGVYHKYLIFTRGTICLGLLSFYLMGTFFLRVNQNFEFSLTATRSLLSYLKVSLRKFTRGNYFTTTEPCLSVFTIRSIESPLRNQS